MRNQHTGDQVSIKYIREGELISQKMSLTAFPKEVHPSFETIYDQVNHAGNQNGSALKWTDPFYC